MPELRKQNKSSRGDIMTEEQPITTEYKGHKIAFNQYCEEWRLTDSHEVSKKSLQAVKDYIDKLEKKGFQRFQAYVYNYDGFKEVTVTSIDDEKRFWVSGLSSRQLMKTVYKTGTDNLTRFESIKRNQNKIQELQKEIREIEETLEKVVV